jgi:hypothetical protein
MAAAIFPALEPVCDFERVVGFGEEVLERGGGKILALGERCGISLGFWLVWVVVYKLH